MMERIASDGVQTIIVETANRFARDLIVQETGFAMLKERGIELIAADSPTSFLDDTPTAKLIRQVLGAVAEFDKAMTVAKLRAARDRKRASTGRCEGRKSHAELNPDLVREAKRLRRRSPKGHQRSLREISAMLSTRGFVSAKGKPFSASSIKSMIEARKRAPVCNPRN
jgi:DNA invertase Pin-like site-specific DNA recombinase